MSPYLAEALVEHRRHTAQLLMRLDALCASGVDGDDAEPAAEGASTAVLLAHLTDRLRADDARLASLVVTMSAAADPAPARNTVPCTTAMT
ncbi:MAG: hypothetical protein JWM47_3059 [Acidimicrobiales bacterium]|nr:hypothetical protein [Acidimicrobiales bacterium]